MSGVAKKLMGTTAAGGGFTAIEDVFSTYLYTGDDLVKTITNGIDIAGEGGLVWIKSRASATSPNFDHMLFDTERGVTKKLASNTTAAELTNIDTLTAFNSDGFTVDDDDGTNKNLENYASWTFRKAPRFFDVVTYTGNGTLGREIPHNLGVVPGMVVVKCTSATQKWTIKHKDAGNLFFDTAAANSGNDKTFWGDGTNYIPPTDTVFTIGHFSTFVNNPGDTYVAYLFAHDPLGPSGDGSDGLIACGSFTTGGAENTASVELGWEPQFILWKSVEPSAWEMNDTMRGLNVAGSLEARLFPNYSDAESVTNIFNIRPTGFDVQALAKAYIYIAIRRGPMRAPESGTEVYLPSTATGVVTTGFPVDLHIGATQAGLSTNHRFHDRLRGGTKELVSSSTAAETTVTDLLFDGNEGLRFSFGSGQVNHFFRRAPEFFDVVAYTGDGVAGRTVPHNLGVAPEMMIVRRRSGVSGWSVYTAPTGNSSWLQLESVASVESSVLWAGTTPTSEVFYVTDESAAVNASGETYIAYLFSTLAGISKVGSYTGNGSSQTINCGFTSGARFILIKRTDTSGAWYVWDTARGIVTGNDPHLSLNTTAAEVTTDDSIDPDSSGFIVNQVAATNINVSAASYIFYAVS